MDAKHITHADIAEFATSRVNLKPEHETTYREQAKRVRDRIESYISENPSIGFVKTLLSGSLAKHTALRTLNDIDIALYVKAGESPEELNELLRWVQSSLQKTYPNTPIELDPPCVVIKFSGTDLDVEIMPVLSSGDEDGYGTIWDPYSVRKTYTSIPRHLEFIKTRRTKQKPHFAQIARLLKYWKGVNDLEFRSFLIELVLSKVADEGGDFSDYPSAMLSFFNRILQADLEDRFIFTDFFPASKFPAGSQDAIQVWDPVTPDNNVASDYSDSQRSNIVDAAESAVDAITYAATASRKSDAVDSWRTVLGPSFN